MRISSGFVVTRRLADRHVLPLVKGPRPRERKWTAAPPPHRTLVQEIRCKLRAWRQARSFFQVQSLTASGAAGYLSNGRRADQPNGSARRNIGRRFGPLRAAGRCERSRDGPPIGPVSKGRSDERTRCGDAHPRVVGNPRDRIRRIRRPFQWKRRSDRSHNPSKPLYSLQSGGLRLAQAPGRVHGPSAVPLHARPAWPSI